MRLGLRHLRELDRHEVARRRHAFALMCGVYGHEFVDCGEAEVVYADTAIEPVPELPLECQQISIDGTELVLMKSTGERDLLGELSFWVCGAGEYAHGDRDDLGRVSFAQSVQARLGLDPTVAWGTRVLDALHAELRQVHGSLPEAPPPFVSGCFWVASPTHDIDFVPLTRRASTARIIRNVGVAAVGFRSSHHVASVLRGVALAFRQGKNPLDNARRVLDRERELDIRATWNVLVQRGHRRDGNYDLNAPAVQALLSEIVRGRGEIGVHGSYTSVDPGGDLPAEYERLRSIGHAPRGGRQHWLRGEPAALFPALARAGAAYDSTMGWSDMPGFRHGLSTPYVPWDHDQGRPHGLIELPLVVMDTALAARAAKGADWRAEVSAVLTEARRGPGGVSVLWHDTAFGDAQLPRGIADLYWALPRDGECWTTASSITEAIGERYERARALPWTQPQR